MLKLTTLLPSGDEMEWEIDTDKLTYHDHFPALISEIERDGGPRIFILEFVRVTHLGREMTLVVDENGIAAGRQPNNLASKIYRNNSGRQDTIQPAGHLRGFQDSQIYGAAILIDGAKREILD